MTNRFTPIVASLLLLGPHPTSADDKSVPCVGFSETFTVFVGCWK
jgi:hypothetical protein